MQDKNDEKENEILDSLDNFNDSLINNLSNNEKKDLEKIWIGHLHDYFKKNTEIDINDSSLSKQSNKKMSMLFNEEDFMRFSKGIIRKFLSSSISPKKKSSFKKKLSKVYSNQEIIPTPILNPPPPELRSSKILTCTNQLSTLISIRRPKKNIRRSLLKKPEIVTQTEVQKKITNKDDDNIAYNSYFNINNNNSISKKITRHRKYSDYRKVVTFKDFEENKIESDEYNSLRHKNRCRLVKRKDSGSNQNYSNNDGNKTFDYKISSTKNINKGIKRNLDEYFHQFNGRKSDKRHKTVSANSNIVVNDLIKKGLIEEPKYYKKSSLALFNSRADNFNSKKRRDRNKRDSTSTIKNKNIIKNVRKSISGRKENNKRPSFTVIFTKPIESPNKNKNKVKKKDTFFDKQIKKYSYKQKQIKRDSQRMEEIEKKEMRSIPEISEKSKKIMKKKGKHIPLYKRSLELHYEKQFNYAVNEENKKSSELEQNYTSIHSKNLKINKNFFNDQINWKKNISDKTNSLRTLLNSNKEEKLIQNLSFRPKLSEKTTLLANKKRQNKSDDRDNIFKRLFDESKSKEKNLIKLHKKLSPNFKPVINDASSSIHNFTLRKNYTKNVPKNIKFRNNEEKKKINTSRQYLRKDKVLFFEDEKLSLDSFPSLMDKDTEYEEIINNINSININEEKNKQSKYFNIKYLENLFKRKSNKESNISSTELCSDKNRNNIIPLPYTKVPPLEQKSITHRGFFRQESAPLSGRTNRRKNKNIPITERYHFDANSQSGKFYKNINNNFDNNGANLWENNKKKKKKEKGKEIWTIEDIGENISEIKSEESWISKIKQISKNEKNYNLEENKTNFNNINKEIGKKSSFKNSNNSQNTKGLINRLTKKKKGERRISVELIDSNQDKPKEGKLFSINLNNIRTCPINGNLKPFVIKEKQNIFYKFFRKKDY